MPSNRASGPGDAVSCGTRDVLDDVLQRLFATGIGLQVLADREPDAAAANQLRRHIAELDDTIEEIRSQVVAAAPSGMVAHRHHSADRGGAATLSAAGRSVVS